MKKTVLVLSAAVLGGVMGIAQAGESTVLTEAQMDRVRAGTGVPVEEGIPPLPNNPNILITSDPSCLAADRCVPVGESNLYRNFRLPDFIITDPIVGDPILITD